MTLLATIPEKPASITSANLADAKKIQAKIISAEERLRAEAEQIFILKWLLGYRLNEFKETIGHGNWMLWLPSNFPELASTDGARVDVAGRAIRFYKDNERAVIPNSWNSTNLKTIAKQFTTDSRRKLMWGYIPAKERPALEGDESVSSMPHYLSFVNHFTKWDRQLSLGHVPMPPVLQFRREMETPLKRIIEIGGREWIMSILGLDEE